jgi:hypothetical protein
MIVGLAQVWRVSCSPSLPPYMLADLAIAAKGAPVATKVVHFSDLSGREAEDEGQLGRLVVLEHPDIGESATLEVFPDEVADLQSAERLVRLEYYAPGERRAQQFTVTADQFNALAKGEDMRALLVRVITTAHEGRGEGAQPARRQRRGTDGSGRGKVNYATLEHAGEPHRGRITEAEKELVRNNLDQINQRLRESGMREIDPSDTTMRDRYGL